MTEQDSLPRRENPEVRHERSDVDVRAIIVWAVGLVLVAVVIHAALYWLLEHYKQAADRRAPASSIMVAEKEVPPPPRLRVAPRDDLAAMRAAEARELQTYGWVDADKKIVRIPIERAMELIAERGLPSRKQPEEERKKSRR